MSQFKAEGICASDERVSGQENKNAICPLIHCEDVVYRSADHQFELLLNAFDVSQGEKVAVTGASGSGKTTLLSLISGYKAAQHGTIEVLGNKLESLSKKERQALRLHQIGIVFQEFRLIEYLTVRDNIALAAFFSQRVDDAGDRVDVISKQLNLHPLLHRYPAQLSQGERQRTAIGRAIFQKPDLLLADEPTGNLDSQTASQVLDYLFQAIDLTGTTLVMVTHDHSLLSRFTRQIDMAGLRGVR